MLSWCELVREALSARLDGEEAPANDAEVDEHLGRCRSCRDFEARLAAITRRIRLHALGPIPDLTAELVAPATRALVATVPGEAARAGRSRYRGSVRWALVARWAAAIVPLGLTLPPLALGAFTHVHVVPSHVPTPCTFTLLVHHLRTVR
ncbi:MAG TPA: zf-HC2 domain-containing protein [Acidimicrobiales bacterium]|nr:zf-HC2 domain-containing protein [Acidimicrobiales bacterium]